MIGKPCEVGGWTAQKGIGQVSVSYRTGMIRYVHPGGQYVLGDDHRVLKVRIEQLPLEK